ncbi:hypothetical protein M0657_012147 [Pyricularia oryzae]|nr:hypothetical protein M0657_012147 [Pyricularia oryzae]
MALHHRQSSSSHNHDRSPIGTCVRHPIAHAEFLELLLEQLERSLDDGITPLAQGGARGVLFKVSLLKYGYTFVSKGTVKAFVKDLKHEAAVYERLQPIQGTYVPVFLGIVDLRLMNRVYYYDHRVYVIHMTFLSWGGCEFDATRLVGGGEEHLKGKAMQSLRAIHQLGVAHKDVRGANMLFNTEVNGFMMIDFERALLLGPPRPPLVQVVPNKRRWKPDMVESINSIGKTGARGQVSKPHKRVFMCLTLINTFKVISAGSVQPQAQDGRNDHNLTVLENLSKNVELNLEHEKDWTGVKVHDSGAERQLLYGLPPRRI